MASSSVLLLLLFSAVLVVSGRHRVPLGSAPLESLVALARRINSDPKATWYASEAIAGFGPRNKDLLRPAAAGRKARQSPDGVDWRKDNLLRDADDQEKCGSCWAIAATHAFDDYRSIKATSKVEPTSAHRLASCCMYAGCNGCQGGKPGSAFYYLNRKGTVPNTCQPYDLYQLCSEPNTCENECSEGSALPSPLTLDTYSVVEATTAQMKLAVAEGPIVAGMLIYTDFLMYKGEIYRYMGGNYLGVHLVEVVGYGSDENGQGYWICKNSWGKNWGDNGYFRIATGIDPESQVGLELPGSVFAPFVAPESTSPAPPSLQTSSVVIGVNIFSKRTDSTIKEIANMAAGVLNPFCAGKDSDRSQVGGLTLVRVNRASHRVIRGGEYTITATYRKMGCPVCTTYEFVAEVDLNGKSSIVQSRYVAPGNFADSRHKTHWMIILGFALLKIIVA
ncbi:uncharacterized protein [Oscarella lobularis]|uniref:uncharacterized protein n=1 Tax=Oscarella lobularis TaxID=121494 RepID=UPI00331309C4